MPTTRSKIFAIIMVGGICMLLVSNIFNIQFHISDYYSRSNNTQEINKKQESNNKQEINNKQESDASKPELDPFDAYLRVHPVYGEMEFPMPETKKKVNILLIVSSAPKRSDRRQAIRDTWWQQCNNMGKVKYILNNLKGFCHKKMF